MCRVVVGQFLQQVADWHQTIRLLVPLEEAVAVVFLNQQHVLAALADVGLVSNTAQPLLVAPLSAGTDQTQAPQFLDLEMAVLVGGLGGLLELLEMAVPVGVAVVVVAAAPQIT